jgi:hypothetical protein
MDKKMLAAFAVALVIVGGGAFYGGSAYGTTHAVSARGAQFRAGVGGGMGGNGQGGFARTGGPGGAGNASFVNGEIIAKDDKSITLKLRDGGSRIVFLSDSTEIAKSAAGTRDDLVSGQTVTVTGKPNDDGSLTAQGVQLRPVMPQQGTAPSAAQPPAQR